MVVFDFIKNQKLTTASSLLEHPDIINNHLLWKTLYLHRGTGPVAPHCHIENKKEIVVEIHLNRTG